MTDQMQGRVLDPGHPCQTPNFDRLIAEGVRFTRAYTPNAVCSPARASLMTGLLPHNHGVLQVTHTGEPDQNVLRTEHPHWAQILQQNGYRTGYFGKWHVEHSESPERFGWEVTAKAARRTELTPENSGGGTPKAPVIGNPSFHHNQPEGYRETLLYGVTDMPPEERGCGLNTGRAMEFLDEALQGEAPWCCFVSVLEPHDPFVCGREAWSRYEVDSLPLAPNAFDDLADRPGLYRKAARTWSGLSERQRREAMACYYATITEIDTQFGKLLARLRESGEWENTIIVLTSDHGELLGAHGLYTKNIGAFEEVYQIPLVISGPGLRKGETTAARVGLHDLHPTLLELTGCHAEPARALPDSRSFAPVLHRAEAEADHAAGFAEYYGGRIHLTQRIVWEGDWKFVFNGFDEDELYHLAADPYELTNLAHDPACEEQLRRMCRLMWQKIIDTGDRSLANSHYASLRLAPYGPCLAAAPEQATASTTPVPPSGAPRDQADG